jgi:flagellar M-ring protein FliF
MAETEQATTAAGLQRTGQGTNATVKSAGTPTEKALELADGLRQRVMALPQGKRNSLIALGLFLAALCGLMVWYANRTDWRVLFNGLEGKDMQQVSQELAAATIPYQLTPDGTGIEVPAAMLDKARMEVAAKGMPQSGRLGFELFDKPNWMGSEFDEKVNYQRALEGELEHTIETLGVVRSARVHLVMAQHSLFSSEDRAAKASVVLKLKRASLDQEQADSIRSLVAGAVENLSVDGVTLVDADGRANLKPRSKDIADADLEQQMESKLIAMLEPLAGRDNVRATVNVSYDESNTERTDEVYDPSQTAALTMQKTEQTAVQPGRVSGIPGTASNSPAGSPAGAAQGSQTAAAPGTPPLLQKEVLPVYPQQGGGAGQSVHEESGTFGVTKHVVHMEESPGRVRRVTAAVVVNDRSVHEGIDKSEHVVWRPRSADEMRRLEELAKAAVGFDGQRGDQVVVENVSFSSNVPEAKLPLAERAAAEARSLLHAQPELGRAIVVGVCGVLLVLFVMRPVARQMTAILREPVLLADGAKEEQKVFPIAELQPEEAAFQSEVERPKVQPPAAAMAALQRQGVFEQVAEHIRREPVQSTRLLEAWIGSMEEMD